MKRILAICADQSSLHRALRLVADKTQTDVACARWQIDEILTLDDLSLYDLIVISPIHWKIPTTSFALVEHLRPRIHGPIVAVGNVPEWRRLMTQAGCDHAVRHDEETPRLIHHLLFPPT